VDEGSSGSGEGEGIGLCNAIMLYRYGDESNGDESSGKNKDTENHEEVAA
jgi:hypothetical protein